LVLFCINIIAYNADVINKIIVYINRFCIKKDYLNCLRFFILTSIQK